MSNPVVDVKVDEKGTAVSVHNFVVSNTYHHVSKVHEQFDYVSVTCKVSDKNLVMMFMNLDEVNSVIEKLSLARDNMISERQITKNMETATPEFKFLEKIT
jgi:hypothetical protein